MFKRNLLIVRHARSQHNVGESEDMDSPITNFGTRMADHVGQFIKEVMYAEGWSGRTSPFLRCLQTTRGITQHTGLKFKVDTGLREYMNHSPHGTEVHIPNRSEEYPEYDWSDYPADGLNFGGEFNEKFLNRMQDFYHSLDDDSIVVSHGLPCRVLLEIGINPSPSQVPVWDYSISNCSLTWIKQGRVVWHGKTLYHELEECPWPKDSCLRGDLLKL